MPNDPIRGAVDLIYSGNEFRSDILDCAGIAGRQMEQKFARRLQRAHRLSHHHVKLTYTISGGPALGEPAGMAEGVLTGLRTRLS